MNNEKFQRRIDQTIRAANKHHRLLAEVQAEIEIRYGVDYGDLDLDEIIDSLDYGNGALTVKEIEEAIKRRGER